jgi:N-acyl-D-aspartate/D-glutamate deacylase
VAETLLLTGAQLADGTGSPLRAGEILVDGDRIAAVAGPGALPRTHAQRDLGGLVLAPGFIDAHSHADNAPLLAEDDTTKILQGVTTEVVGNCGFSLAPHEPARTGELTGFLERLFPPTRLDWTSVAELFARVDAAGSVTNQCPLVGHTSLRIAAMGVREQPAEPEAIRRMAGFLEEGMEAGAFGLSSGLIYPPALFADTSELTELAAVLGGSGRYVTHMRDEGARLPEAVDEALRIGARAGHTHISHLKAAGSEHWGALPAALERIRAAREAGQHISHDVYPYTASSTMLLTLLPPDYLGGDTDQLLARLRAPGAVAELGRALEGTDWDGVLVATTASHRHEGRTIAEIAGSGDPVATLVDLLVSEHLRVAMVHFSMHEQDLLAALADEHTMIGSDGLPPGTGGRPHPRLFGTFPRLLRQYVREDRALSLPEAVRRMTALPAREFAVPDRGLIAEGAVADLVAFDPAAVTDVGDYRDPVHPPAGIHWVCQAGRTTVEDGHYRGPRRGVRLTPAG